MHYIGIVIGTSSICGVAYNPETKELSTAIRTNNSAIPSNRQDEKMQDPAKIMECVHAILKELAKGCNTVASIGITGQMHGILYVDRNGKAASPLFTWQDGRGNRRMAEGTTYAEHLTAAGGYQSATGYGLVTHFYNSRNNLVPRDACKICTIMDYAAMQLTRRRTPLTDYSNGASLGFFNKKRLQFDLGALSAAGIGCEILPEIAPSATLAGYYKNIPVYSAIGDNQAAFIGSVRDRDTDVHITVGTSSQISVYSPGYLEIPTLDTRPLPGGGYIIAGAELCGGYSFTILKNFFAETARLIFGKNIPDDDIYAAMTSLPIPEESTLSVDTLFDGTRQNPEKRGQITGISTSNFLPQELISGFVRGICDALYHHYMHLPSTLLKGRTHIVASGNGFRKNPLLKQAFEKRFGLPVILSACTEEAAFGAAISPYL